MSKKIQHKMLYHKERVLLGDVLPYEVPLLFSNEYFYQYLLNRDASIEPDLIKRILDFNEKPYYTIPLKFKISHNENDFRILSIIHPKNQIDVSDFYDKFKSLILYYCSHSEFSLRRPIHVASLAYFNDSLHKDLFEQQVYGSIEKYDREYANFSTFFVYKKYDKIYKFFEDYKFHENEKKFNKMFSIDVSKCFDSIYTHTIPWAILGKDYVKNNLNKKYQDSFGEEFDRLMQKMNYNETNGIVIGPEFSRIFAEIILQRIDEDFRKYILKTHKLIHKKDYAIFRYVDDYFIFYNDENDRKIIETELGLCLKGYNLHINSLKTENYNKPFITNITVAKEQIKNIFSDSEFGIFHTKEDGSGIVVFSGNFEAKKVITQLKIILRNANIHYRDISNYLFALIERRLRKVIKDYSLIEKHNGTNQAQFKKFIIEILDFIFFVYSSSPKATLSIKLCVLVNEVLSIFRKGHSTVSEKGYIEINIGDIDLIKKKLFDEVHSILKIYVSAQYREVEAIYLINILQSLGDKYLIDPALLVMYLPSNPDKFDYFLIVNLLNYASINPIVYGSVLKKVQELIIEKLEIESKTGSSMLIKAELVFLLFDIMNCPHLEQTFKYKFLAYFGIVSDSEKQKIIDFILKQKLFFSKWRSTNFLQEIVKKRKIEVY